MTKPNDLQAAFEAWAGITPDEFCEINLIQRQAFQAGAAYGKTQERERIIAEIGSKNTLYDIMLSICNDTHDNGLNASVAAQAAIVNKLKALPSTT